MGAETMRIELTFTDDQPLFAVYGLEGTFVRLYGRTEYSISKDPWAETIGTSLSFFIKWKDNRWEIGYKSNRQYTQEEHIRLIHTVLNKANQALAQKQPTELSQEFTALDQIEPFAFGGLYRQMNEHDEPMYESWDQMRERLRNSVTLKEIEADDHLKNWLNGTNTTIWGDETD
jgi:hypothetical protein